MSSKQREASGGCHRVGVKLMETAVLVSSADWLNQSAVVAAVVFQERAQQ